MEEHDRESDLLKIKSAVDTSEETDEQLRYVATIEDESSIEVDASL